MSLREAGVHVVVRDGSCYTRGIRYATGGLQQIKGSASKEIVAVQLSYSKLSTYLDCGWRYKLRYVNRVPTKPKPYFRFGSVLRAVLGRFYLYPGEGTPDLKVLLSLYEEAWPPAEDRSQPNRDKGERILREYYRCNIEHWRPPVYAECVFNVPIGRHTLTGVFDRVDQHEEGSIEVVDYKAQRRMPTQEELTEDLQLSLYALAFEQMVGRLPDRLSMYHLRENRKVSTTRSEEQVLEVREKVLEVGDRMSRGRGFAPKENRECRWCDYVSYCPLRTEEPLVLPGKPVQMELDLTLYGEGGVIGPHAHDRYGSMGTGCTISA